MKLRLSASVEGEGAAKSKGVAFATLVTRFVLPHACTWDMRLWLQHLQRLAMRTPPGLCCVLSSPNES